MIVASIAAGRRALRAVALVVPLLLGSSPPPALAGEAAVELGAWIDTVLHVLNDPALRGAEHERTRRAAVRRVVDEAFAFDEAARRALGRHWAERTAEQQGRFVALFAELVDHAYLGRLGAYDGQRVLVTDDALDGDEGIVYTRVVGRDGDATRVDYLVVRRDGGWRVYDVRLGAISLVGMFRAQFARIIQTGSFEELVRRLETKVLPVPR